jgi:hypothetical protein
MSLFRRRDVFADPIPLAPDLAGFGDRVARLEREHETSGHLWLKKDVVKTGDERPREVLELNAVMVDPAEYLQAIYDETEAQNELTAGVFRLRGIDHDIVWLDGADAEAARAKFC